MKNKFYNFSQNNSGGYFVEDDENGICEEVIIEAASASEAFSKLQEIGEKVSGFNSYCDCCGERWPSYVLDDDGTEIAMIYNKPVEIVFKDLFRTKCFVHYADGAFKKFNHI